FLIDLNLMRKLVAAAELEPADVVLEVGAGTGSLTELLLETGARVVAVEIDRGLQKILRERLGGHARFTLVQGDALAAKSQVNPLILKLLAERPPGAHVAEAAESGAGGDGGRGGDSGQGDEVAAAGGTGETEEGGGRAGHYKLVANLPYQIATPLIVDLLLVEPRFERLVCTIQKEVGERLVAEPRTGEYGPVSIVLQTLAEIRPLAILPATAFWPRPQVESVMVLIRPRPAEAVRAGDPDDVGVEDVPGFVAFVREAFQQRRKVLRRLLRDWPPAQALAVFQRANVNPEARPEELSPGAWRALYAAFRRTRA
ncbi:MAG: rRNA adenine dimethyltransferase family protein, partial [Planctomycetota bacterium]